MKIRGLCCLPHYLSRFGTLRTETVDLHLKQLEEHITEELKTAVKEALQGDTFVYYFSIHLESEYVLLGEKLVKTENDTGIPNELSYMRVSAYDKNEPSH